MRVLPTSLSSSRNVAATDRPGRRFQAHLKLRGKSDGVFIQGEVKARDSYRHRPPRHHAVKSVLNSSHFGKRHARLSLQAKRPKPAGQAIWCNAEFEAVLL